MKIYTNNSHEIIGYDPDYVPSEYSHEYEVSDDFVGDRSYPVMCGYKYEPQYELDFDEKGALKYDDQGNLIYKLGEDGEKIFVGYSFYPFIDSQVLIVLQREADARSSDLATISRENSTLRTAATFAAISFTDAQALAVKNLYPDWSDLPDGTHLEAGQRVRYNGNLYKVRTGQAHDKQSTWTPTDAASLFEAIDEAHAGTLEDPIPAVANMQYYEGKYYSEGDTVYLCTKDTGIPIAQLPSTLVGIYFSIAEV